jgi:hypothetical protein
MISRAICVGAEEQLELTGQCTTGPPNTSYYLFKGRIEAIKLAYAKENIYHITLGYYNME